MPVLSTLGAAIANVYGFTSGLIKDQYFNLVSLLLPGNGTNGAQNNTFLDSSGNTFTITRNGNTTQGTFSPFSQTGWGAYFDGSNDSVSVVSDASWALSGVFSVEAWVWNGGTQTNYPGIFATPTNGFVLAFKTDTSQFGVAQSGVAWTSVLATPPTANTWTHVAVTRDSSNVMRMFYNGVLKASATVTTSFAQGALTIGAQSGSGSLLGYLSNARWIKGSIPTSYQTSSTTIDASIFTPSTSSLTTSSQGATSGDVKLLALQNNRFIDNSSSPFTLTPNNGVAITPFSPFAPTQSYSAAAVGGSGYFDGTGDYLQSSANTAFDPGSGDWSCECWFFPTFSSGTDKVVLGNAASGSGFDFLMASTSVFAFRYYDPTYRDSGALAAVTNAWTHVAVCKTSTRLSVFLNGNRVFTTTSFVTITASTNPFRVGASNINNPFEGYISNVRIVKGSTPYDPAQTTITIPTAPVTAITNTQYLLNFTNAGVVDATAKNVLETVGNAQISTTQSKWGGGSISVSSGNYLTAPSNPLLPFGTGDFTIEFWAYWNGGAFSTYATAIDTRNGSFAGGLAIAANITTGAWYVSIATQEILSTTAAAASWQHVAVTRQGTSLKLFVNGTQAGSTYTSSDNFSNTTLRVGVRPDNQYPWNGYIDDLRITKGLARYTGTTLTVPTAPFPVQ